MVLSLTKKEIEAIVYANNHLRIAIKRRGKKDVLKSVLKCNVLTELVNKKIRKQAKLF